MNTYVLGKLREKMEFSFEAEISAESVDRFSMTTGDISPIHVSDDFARARGFRGRLVHGMFLGGLISQMVGVYLPGENALLQMVNLMFLSPAYVGDHVKVWAMVDQTSDSTHTMVLKVAVSRLADGVVLARGKAHVGFTEPVQQ